MIFIDNEQFSCCIKEYEKLIFTICMSFVKNYFDAEDLAQQTFLAAYKNLNSFDGKNIKGWLTTIAANKCRDFLKNSARSNISLVNEDECEIEIEDSSNMPEEIVVNNSTEDKIKSLCNRLKEPYKDVAINYFCNEIKISTLAKEKNKSIKTLETQLYRAKKLLRELWKEEFM